MIQPVKRTGATNRITCRVCGPLAIKQSDLGRGELDLIADHVRKNHGDVTSAMQWTPYGMVGKS